MNSIARPVTALRAGRFSGMWMLVFTGSVLYCWLYEYAHGHPVGDLPITLRWAVEQWSGWILISGLMAWRSPQTAWFERVCRHRVGFVAVVVASPLIAVAFEWHLHRMFEWLDWALIDGLPGRESYWLLVFERAPLCVVGAGAVAGALWVLRAAADGAPSYASCANAPSFDVGGSARGDGEVLSALAAAQRSVAPHPVRSADLPGATDSARGGADILPALAAARRGAVFDSVASTTEVAPPCAPDSAAAGARPGADITVITPRGPIDISIPEIEALLAAENYVEICLSSGPKYLQRSTLQGIGAALAAPSLLRIGRSTIINVEHLDARLPGNKLRLTSGRVVRIGRTYRVHVDEQLTALRATPGPQTGQ